MGEPMSEASKNIAKRRTILKLRTKIKNAVTWLQGFADRLWYPPFIGLLAALDNLILIIPNDGILISSSMLTPKRWYVLALCVAIGSTIGAVGLAALIEVQGLPWLLDLYPGIDQTATWRMTDEFFHNYGLIVVFVVAVTPVLQQPAVVFASLAGISLYEIATVIFVGRLIKFLVMAYAGSHAPKLLNRMWGVKGELEEVGVDVNSKIEGPP
jgi:membrane protein YqaA with SNARE-associated domain